MQSRRREERNQWQKKRRQRNLWLLARKVCTRNSPLKRKVREIWDLMEYVAFEILYSIEKHAATIVVGETGSGKSTKIP